MDHRTPGLVMFCIIWLALSVLEVLMAGVYPRSLLGLCLILVFSLPLAAVAQWGWSGAETWFDRTSLGRRAAREAEGTLGSGTRALVALLAVLGVGGVLYFGAVMVERWTGVGRFLGTHLGRW